MNLPRALEITFPLVLICLVPLEILLGISKGYYPTQGSLMVLIGGWVGLKMILRLRRPFLFPVDRDADPEALATTQINRHLNSGLGSSLLGMSIILALFCLLMIALIPPRPLPLDSLNPRKLVELGFIVLFNLIGGALIMFGARVYLSGRR